MSNSNTISNPNVTKQQPGGDLRWPNSLLWRTGEPSVRKIGLGDIRDALAKGIEDFKAVPTHIVFLCIFYPLVGLLLFRLSFGYEMLPLVYPIVAGLALIGPFAAIGLYQLSRHRERGLEVNVVHALDALRSPSIGAIARIGLALVVIFLAWLAVAQLVYEQTIGGTTPNSLGEFGNRVLATAEGQQLIAVGNGIGFLFALLVLVVSVVSLPMLIDRHVSAGVAVRTSVRAVIENPVTMAIWGLVVVVGLILGSLPFFFGLAIVFPVLGHATWHLYRKVVSADEVI